MNSEITISERDISNFRALIADMQLPVQLVWTDDLPNEEEAPDAASAIRCIQEKADHADTEGFGRGWISILSEKLRNADGEPFAFSLHVSDILRAGYVLNKWTGRREGFFIFGGNKTGLLDLIRGKRFPLGVIVRGNSILLRLGRKQELLFTS